MARRYLAILLCAAILLGAGCVTAAAEDTDTWEYYNEQSVGLFPDVQPGEWFYDDVMALAGAGVIGGFPDGTFRPNDTVTTGQALKMVLLVVGCEEPELVASHWARGYMNLALDMGILERGEITDLDVSISRQLLATLAARATEAERTAERYSFSDAQNDDVQALTDSGIIGGYPDGTFRPDNSLTRAELSAIIHRIQTHRALNTEQTEGGEIEIRTTEKGVDFIKTHEGFTATAYWDYSQYSIGYGTRCEKNEYPNGITTEQADRLLRLKLQEIESLLDNFCEQNDVRLNDAQYDALISLTYNVGASWMSSSCRLASLISSGRYTTNELASAMGIWCHVTINGNASILNSLVSRRIRELKLFLYGDYAGTDSTEFCTLIYQNEHGGVEADIALYEKGGTYTPLFSATGDGDFIGWFTQEGEEITEQSTVRGDQKVWAMWQGEDMPEDEDPYEDDWNEQEADGFDGEFWT